MTFAYYAISFHSLFLLSFAARYIKSLSYCLSLCMTDISFLSIAYY